jgi:hypothetical protein
LRLKLNPKSICNFPPVSQIKPQKESPCRLQKVVMPRPSLPIFSSGELGTTVLESTASAGFFDTITLANQD